MVGVISLWIIDALPIERQFSTAAAFLLRPTEIGIPASIAAFDINASEVAPTALPNAPNMGRYSIGSGVGMEALASPIALQAMKPPLMIISGLTPNIAGFHSTRSASLPGSIEPISCDIPCVMAGLIVYLAT